MPYRSLIGKTAPTITLPNYDGESYTFTPGTKGIPAALFFYPESGSYGCTKEACQFRDAIAEKDNFQPGKVQVIGISPDPVEKQKLFVEKEKLTYPVLSDANKEAIKAYGIGKGMLGFVSVARVTFIVDKHGIIRDALETTINAGAHSKFVEKWLHRLEEEASAPTVTTTAETDHPTPVATATSVTAAAATTTAAEVPIESQLPVETPGLA